MLDYHALVAYQMFKAIVSTGKYVNSLKVSKCTLLPSRSIFSAIYPEAKICEKFFLSLIKPDVDKTHNHAYREKFSCTALLLNQFHRIATTNSVYALNADIKKAFNTMSRKSILNSVSNPFLANIYQDGCVDNMLHSAWIGKVSLNLFRGLHGIVVLNLAQILGHFVFC